MNAILSNIHSFILGDLLHSREIVMFCHFLLKHCWDRPNQRIEKCSISLIIVPSFLVFALLSTCSVMISTRFILNSHSSTICLQLVRSPYTLVAYLLTHMIEILAISFMLNSKSYRRQMHKDGSTGNLPCPMQFELFLISTLRWFAKRLISIPAATWISCLQHKEAVEGRQPSHQWPRTSL